GYARCAGQCRGSHHDASWRRTGIFAVIDQTPVVVVTGAASGIGGAVATLMSEAGWVVGGIDLVPADTDVACVADVADADAVATAVARIASELGAPRALVTSAGYYERRPFSEID